MDELHMLDDDRRGYLLEVMATKLLSLQQEIQIVGLSATLSVCQPIQRLFLSRSSYCIRMLKYWPNGLMLNSTSPSIGQYQSKSTLCLKTLYIPQRRPVHYSKRQVNSILPTTKYPHRQADRFCLQTTKSSRSPSSTQSCHWLSRRSGQAMVLLSSAVGGKDARSMVFSSARRCPRQVKST